MYQLLYDALPWLAAFYALDGLTDLRRGFLLFRTSALGSFEVVRSGLRHQGWAPWVEAFVAFDWPFLVSEEALLIFAPRRRDDPVVVEAADIESVPWADLAPKVEGKRAVSREKVLLAAPSKLIAARLVDELTALASESGRRQTGFQQRTRLASSPKVVAEVRARQRPWRIGLQVTASILFAGLFGLGALVAYVPSAGVFAEELVVFLGTVLMAEMILAIGFLRSENLAWRPAASRALALLAWPVATLRPLAHLSAGLCTGHEAVAVAAALLPGTDLARFASRELARTRESRQRATDASLMEALECREWGIRLVLERAGVKEAILEAPPTPRTGEAAWCPVCRSRFLVGIGLCTDCGVKLVPFERQQAQSHPEPG